MSQTEAAPPPEGGLKDTLRSLDQYWFGRGSPVTLGIYRIFLGCLAFVNFLLLGAYWESWFSERGFVPSWIGQLWLYPTVRPWAGGPDVPRINVLNGIVDPRITIPFYIIVTLASITTALGLWTRVSTFVLALGIVTLHHRNAAILHGGDTVLRVMALYLMLAPCGEACSLDRLIGLWKGTAPPQPRDVSLWPQRLITFNVALVYFTTVWLKYFGNYWKEGLATWFPARLAEFYRFPVPGFLNELPFVKFTTYGTLLVEFALATLVFFRPLRNYVVIAGILMHMYIEYSMNIPLFSFLMTTAYINFYDGEELTAAARKIGQRFAKFGVVIRYPIGTRLRPEAAGLLNAVDPLGLAVYEPGTETRWTAVRANGSAMSALLASWTRSIGTWFFAWIPGIWKRVLENSTEPLPTPAPVEPPAPTNKSKRKRPS